MGRTHSFVTDEVAAPSRTASARARSVWRRTWPNIAVLLALAVWWPAGFWGTGAWPHLPLRVQEGDMLLLGAVAAAASVSLVVRSPWPRLLVVVVLSGVGWLLDAPARDTYTDERLVLAVLLALGALVGILIGARGTQGATSAATVLAVVTGLSPATWPHGALLAVALALPFAAASWKTVAPTLWRVAGVLLTWLVTALLARSLTYGWAVLHPSATAGSKAEELRRIGLSSWEFLRTQWWRYVDALLQGTMSWFWVALVLALVVVAGRAVLHQGGRRPVRTAPASRGAATSGAPRR